MTGNCRLRTDDRWHLQILRVKTVRFPSRGQRSRQRQMFRFAPFILPPNARMAARRRSHGSDLLIERDRALELRGTRRKHPGPDRHKAPTAQDPRCRTQRAGIAPPHAEGDRSSGVTSDRESNAFISVPASFVGGVPLTRAMNPWPMPEASL